MCPNRFCCCQEHSPPVSSSMQVHAWRQVHIRVIEGRGKGKQADWNEAVRGKKGSGKPWRKYSLIEQNVESSHSWEGHNPEVKIVH